MTDSGKKFLDQAYGLEDAAKTQTFYQEWAASYEEEIIANGYVTPRRCAAALAQFVNDESAPLLDLGCGTGLSGEAFHKHSFTTIDGTDFSDQMLAYARTKTGIYRKLILGDLNHPLPGAAQAYTNMAAVGVFSPGHAPAEMIASVIEKLPPAGCFVFSLNDHTLESPEYQQCIDDLVKTGRVEVMFREYGEHLPKRGIKAVVYVLRKR